MCEPPVHVVIVAYHAPTALASCLAALGRDLIITVVDNSSSMQVQSVVADYGAVYVADGVNHGFAAGVNIGVGQQATEDYDVLLLNPDAIITPEAIVSLSQFLRGPANSRVAAVAPRLQSAAGVEQRVVWPFPSPARMCLEALGLGRVPARSTFVVGAVLLIRHEAIAAVGLFDERFFLYAEEADWQRRAHSHGWRSAVCPAAVAYHAGGGASESEAARQARFHAAQETYIRKWYGRVGWFAYRLAACCGAAVRAAILPRQRRSAAAHRCVMYLFGPRRYARREHIAICPESSTS